MSDVVLDRPTDTGSRPADYPLGVSRPPLTVADLPTPEEVWNVPTFGRREMVRFALGPSLIALGAAVGSGEWLLGPLNVGKFGFVGIGWLITVAAVLQAVYNVEICRYTIATGEVPILGFARVPPGLFMWLPLSLLAIFSVFLTGTWAKAAAKGLFALLEGRVAGPGDTGRVQLMTFGLLAAVLGITLAFRRITRGLELLNGGLIAAELLFLLVLGIVVVPWGAWWEAIRGFVVPATPPAGATAGDLGALVGFTGLTAGLNWCFFGHYRDKGYGMGHRVGYLCGARGEARAVRDVGFAFPDDAANAACWRRWMRILRIDMYGVFLPGAIIGMLLPTVLVFHLAATSGTAPALESIDTYAASALGAEYGRGLFYATLLFGFLILFDTQIGIFEALVRNVTDVAGVSRRVQNLGDPRRLYFGIMVVLLVVIGWVTTLSTPGQLLKVSANLTNAGALIFPFALMYLNRRLPRPARPPAWTYVALLANTAFFGFFFANFVWTEVTGTPLVTF